MAGVQSRVWWDDSSLGHVVSRHYLLESLDVSLGPSMVDTDPLVAVALCPSETAV